jgi:mRNA-degrading endonuclease RelE of RelBE toxin-antitoxin system
LSYQVILSPTAKRDMSGIPLRIVPAIVAFVFGDLAANPRRVGKALGQDFGGAFSVRRGPYRVLFDIDDVTAVVQILRVAHRADVYRPR